MVKGRRVKGRGPSVLLKGTMSSAKQAEVIPSASAKAGGLSDESEDFLPLEGARCGGDNDSSADEALMMRQMGLEGAEDAADEEEEEDEGSAEEEPEDAEPDGPEIAKGSDSGSSLDGEGARTAWGRQAKDFYGESSSCESSDDEEVLKFRAAEAVRVTEVEDVQGMNEEHFGADPRALEGLMKLLDMQGKALPGDRATKKKENAERGDKDFLWRARLDAEVDAILEGFSASAQQQPQKQQAAAAGLSEEALQEIVASAHPELQGLLAELRDALVAVTEKVEPVISLARRKQFLTKEGVSLFDTKNQLLLSYLSYLSYYIVLKAHGIPIASHPVVERLIESRLLLQKIRPVEAALKPQLEKFLVANEDSSKASSARARPEDFVAVGESDDALEDEELGDESGCDDIQTTDTRTYRPPKMLAMEYTGDGESARKRADRELQRAAARLQKSELVRSVREMAGGAPEEIGIERWLASVAHGRAVKDAGLGDAARGDGDEEEIVMMRRAFTKKDKKAQAAHRALFERRAAAAVGSTLEDLTVFAEQPISLEEDGFDSSVGPLRRSKVKGVLSHYLNAAKQAANEAAKAEKANAQKLVFARQQSVLHLSRNKDAGRPAAKASPSDGECDEQFEAMASEARKQKAQKKQRMKDKARLFMPTIEEEVKGQRGVTREIEKNRGLTRKRKKFEGNARVHNRMKYQEKAKKLKSIRPEMRAVEDRSYEGESSGLRADLKRSQTLR